MGFNGLTWADRAFGIYDAQRTQGFRITRWNLTAEQREDLSRATGQARFLLGHPVSSHPSSPA